MSDPLFRFGFLDDTNSVREFIHPDTFAHQTTSTGASRLEAAPKSPLPLFLDLAEVLTPPFDVLYVLHTSRCDSELGRYQSPPLDREAFRVFASKFAKFFSTDGRHDVWLHSGDPESIVVWDRHDLIRAYGPVERFIEILRQKGLHEGVVSIPAPHTHHYHARFDNDERRILRYFDWDRTALQPGDEQYRPSVLKSDGS